MPRGQKKCDKCGHLTGPRAKECPKCREPFLFKLKPKNEIKIEEEIDWRSLKQGDLIKVLQGSGPYRKREDGTIVYLGYKGIFKVDELDEDGIHAYPVKAQESGHCYIYMGEEKKSKYGSVLEAHKIQKARRKNDD